MQRPARVQRCLGDAPEGDPQWRRDSQAEQEREAAAKEQRHSSPHLVMAASRVADAENEFKFYGGRRALDFPELPGASR